MHTHRVLILWRRHTRSVFSMDSILSVGIGLGLRLLLHVASQHNRLGSPLIGLWEGIVLYHLSEKLPPSVDPYIAYGLRLLVDFLFTESISRMMIVLLWTALGMLVSEALGPSHWYDTSHERQSKSKRTRTIPRVQTFTTPNRSLHSEHPVSHPNNPALPLVEARPATPPSPPYRVPSPPNSFLDGRSETYSPPRLMHLPTPPETSVPDGFDHDSNNLSLAAERQSIPEFPYPDPIVVLGSDTALNDTVSRRLAAIDHPTSALAPGGPAVLDPDVLEYISHPVTGHNQSDQPRISTPPPQQLSPIYPSVHSFPEFAAVTGDVPPPGVSSTLAENPEAIDDRADAIASSSNLINYPITFPMPATTNIVSQEPVAVSDHDILSVGEAVSVISTSSRDGLNSRAEILRQQARAEEKERSRLENEFKRASNEGRIRDAFLLRGHIKTAEDRATKLHQRAARRYFLGTLIYF